MILSSRQITRYMDQGKLEIKPFSQEQLQPNGIDLRVGEEMARVNEGEEYRLGKEEGKEFIVQPNERVLFKTLEELHMPNNLVGFMGLRSSMARLGLMAPMTVVDVGFQGNLTLALTGSSFPVKIKSGDRVWHLVLCEAYEGDKVYGGKYQGSKGLVGFMPDQQGVSSVHPKL